MLGTVVVRVFERLSEPIDLTLDLIRVAGMARRASYTLTVQEGLYEFRIPLAETFEAWQPGNFTAAVSVAGCPEMRITVPGIHWRVDAAKEVTVALLAWGGSCRGLPLLRLLTVLGAGYLADDGGHGYTVQSYRGPAAAASRVAEATSRSAH